MASLRPQRKPEYQESAGLASLHIGKTRHHALRCREPGGGRSERGGPEDPAELTKIIQGHGTAGGSRRKCMHPNNFIVTIDNRSFL